MRTQTLPNVDFYLLNTSSQQDIYRFLCRLVDKAYQQQQQAYIYVQSAAEAQTLDDLLWTFRDISFIPHQIGETSQAFPPSIVIGTDKPAQRSFDVLFNLTPEAPAFFSDFSRIIEIVGEEKQHKSQSRKKYKLYKEQNCPLTTHNISLPC